MTMPISSKLEKYLILCRLKYNPLLPKSISFPQVDIDLGKSFVDYAAALAKNYTKQKEECKKFSMQQVL